MSPLRSATAVQKGCPHHLASACSPLGRYRPQLPDAQGVLHSRVFPGLCLSVAPLLAGDDDKVLAALAGQEPPETSVNSKSCPF